MDKMEATYVDDLLQFKDYGDSSSVNSSPAQINVNSPTHHNTTVSMASASTTAGNMNTNNSATGGRQRGDPLTDLIYDMSTSAQTISDNAAAGVGTGGSGSTGASVNFDGSVNANKVSFLTLEYYQQFFDVDTYIVLERIANSMIPKRAASNYLRLNIGLNPDLYGPFWITVTLIFSIAISGNIASYLQYASDSYHWHYNFHLVSYAATCIFLYANIVPIVMWLLFKYTLKPSADNIETESASYTPSLLSLMCIYGYSLTIYIPVSILWVIQISILQWLLVITAALLSGCVLIVVLAPALRNSKLSLFLIIGILGAHFLLAAGFMLYFFHVPSSSATLINKSLVEQSNAAPLTAITTSSAVTKQSG